MVELKKKLFSFPDRLFGSCQSLNRVSDPYEYYLDSDTLQSLEFEIQRLISHDYTWNSLYTQCVLGNILLAFRLGKEEYDGTWCDRGGITQQQFDEELTDETLDFLVNIPYLPFCTIVYHLAIIFLTQLWKYIYKYMYACLF